MPLNSPRLPCPATVRKEGNLRHLHTRNWTDDLKRHTTGVRSWPQDSRQIIAQDIDQSKRHVLELKHSLTGKKALDRAAAGASEFLLFDTMPLRRYCMTFVVAICATSVQTRIFLKLELGPCLAYSVLAAQLDASSGLRPFGFSSFPRMRRAWLSVPNGLSRILSPVRNAHACAKCPFA